MKKIDHNLENQQFGRWTVLYKVENGVCPFGQKVHRWMCRCSCENATERIVNEQSLLRGLSTSCGCYQKEIISKKNKKYCQYDLQTEKYGIGITSQNIHFYFDKEDYDRIKSICWFMNKRGYIAGYNNGKEIYLHRFIMNDPKDGLFIDHINGNPMDNRKCNLRFVNPQQNAYNRKMLPFNTSCITGVTWYKRDSKWMAQMINNGKHIHLGYYDNFDDAVKARKAAEEKYYGEYSYDNSRVVNDKEILQLKNL